MGANNSTGKLTLVNDEKAGVIKLSESLAHRLRGQIENEASGRDNIKSIPRPSPPPPPLPVVAVEPTLPPPPMPGPPPQLPTPPAVEDLPQPAVSNEEAEMASSVTSGDKIPVWSAYAKEAHLMATRLREEKEMELKMKDEEWRNKLLDRENEYTDMSKLSEEHLTATMKEVENLFVKVSCAPVCQDRQESVLKCYQGHSSQTLRCSDEVEGFARCVDLSRLQSMRERAS